MSKVFSSFFSQRDEEANDILEEEDWDTEESAEDFNEEGEFWPEDETDEEMTDHVSDASTSTPLKGILKKSTPFMAGGLSTPQNPVTAASSTYRQAPASSGFTGAKVGFTQAATQSAPGFQSIPTPSLSRYTTGLLNPRNDPAFSRAPPPFRGDGPWPKPSSMMQASRPLTGQTRHQVRALRSEPKGPDPLSEVEDAIAILDRPDGTQPMGDIPKNTNTRGPPIESPDLEPPAPSGIPYNPTPQGPGWDFSSLQLILESPLVSRNILPSSIPSPLGYFSYEQVSFYLIKKYGNEVYDSWRQANGDWHGLPALPDTEDSDARPATKGLREALKGSTVTEPELNFCIWAPKTVGVDVYFKTEDEKDDSRLPDWEVADESQLRPRLGPTPLFQHTYRLKNCAFNEPAPDFPIWNGIKGGVYKFPSAPPMSIEKRISETSNEYYERYNDEVGRLLTYPNQTNAYEGAKKDRGAYRLSDKVVRREFAIDIRRIKRRYQPPYVSNNMPAETFAPFLEQKETIFVNDIARKTEQAFLEDARDGLSGGAGIQNDQIKTLPTINTGMLYGEFVDRPSNPWLILDEKEMELRKYRVDTINAVSGPLKRPFLHEEFDNEATKDLIGNSAYFVINTDPRPLKINGRMLLSKGQIAGPLPEFAWFEAPGGQVAFWWGLSGTFYKPVMRIGREIGNTLDKYAPGNYSGTTTVQKGSGPPERTAAEKAEEIRKRTAEAAARRKADLMARNAATFGTAAYRRPPGTGSSRFSSKSSPEELHLRGGDDHEITQDELHLRGGAGRPHPYGRVQYPIRNGRRVPLVTRLLHLDPQGNYYLREMTTDLRGKQSISPIRSISYQEAKELERKGVPRRMLTAPPPNVIPFTPQPESQKTPADLESEEVAKEANVRREATRQQITARQEEVRRNNLAQSQAEALRAKRNEEELERTFREVVERQRLLRQQNAQAIAAASIQLTVLPDQQPLGTFGSDGTSNQRPLGPFGGDGTSDEKTPEEIPISTPNRKRLVATELSDLPTWPCSATGGTDLPFDNSTGVERPLSAEEKSVNHAYERSYFAFESRYVHDYIRERSIQQNYCAQQQAGRPAQTAQLQTQHWLMGERQEFEKAMAKDHGKFNWLIKRSLPPGNGPRTLQV